MSFLKLRGLGKRYGNVVALEKFCLEVSRGEFVVLVGPSGCGKTTTLRLLAGLECPSEGSIELDGRDIARDPPWSRAISMVFQTDALFPHMTVNRNLLFGIRKSITARTAAFQVEEMARTLGIQNLLIRHPSQLSAGQRQRVALGRALLGEPRLLLLDEPFAHLDTSLRASLREELLRLHSRLKITIVFVTHDPAEAMTSGDRLVVLREGHVEQVGNPEEIYGQPRTTFVARFLGNPPINLLQVPVRLSGTNVHVPIGRQETVIARGKHEWRKNFLLAGIRPEDLRIREADTGAAFCGEVELVESLGKEKVLTVRCEGHMLRAMAPRDTPVAKGSRVGLDLSAEGLLFFDPDSGELIEASAEKP